MGTETTLHHFYYHIRQSKYIKLNNPLMGTETLRLPSMDYYFLLAKLN